MRNPLAEPALFGAPQAAAAGASLVIAFGFAPVRPRSRCRSPASSARSSRSAALVAIAGRRASLTVTLLAGLALASFAGAMTALILNLAPNPFVALEIAFWLLGSLEDRSARSSDHRGAVLCRELGVLALNARAFRALTLGEDAAASLGVDIDAHAPDGGDRRRARRRRGGRGRRRDRLRRPGRAASGAPRGRLRSGAGVLPAALPGAALLLAADVAVRLGPSARSRSSSASSRR